jgi:hypothetical protein
LLHLTTHWLLVEGVAVAVASGAAVVGVAAGVADADAASATDISEEDPVDLT